MFAIIVSRKDTEPDVVTKYDHVSRRATMTYKHPMQLSLLTFRSISGFMHLFKYLHI